MAELSRFFDSTPEDERHYTADEFAEYFRRLLTNGIFNGGTNLKVDCDGNNIQTYIQEGFAWIEGYLYKVQDEPFYVTHDLPDTQLDRIDRVVLRLNRSLEVRSINAIVLKGEPSSNPTPPNLTRDDNIYDISLAQVKIEAGKSYIEPYQITDERLDNNVCGLVNSQIQADTTEIFNQFKDHYEAKSTRFESDWQAWLNKNLPQFQQQWNDWFNTNTASYDNSWNTWFNSTKNEWNDFFSNAQNESYLTGADVGVTVASQQEFAAHKAQIVQKQHEIIIVGDNADFSNINEALEYLSKRHARFWEEGYTAEILLASGFGMEEQVFVDGIDLGWITISSEDEEVTINRASLTEDRFSMSNFPAFSVRRGSLPVINTLFNMNDTGTSTNRHGIFVLDNSKAKISSGAGIKNSGGSGITVFNSSKVTTIDAIFLNSGIDGIRAQRSSVVNASGIDVSNASNVGIHILDSSSANVQNSISNNSGICILAIRSCIVNANGSSATGASQYGIRASLGSSINATSSNARVGSVDSQDDISVYAGSIINAFSATGGTSQLVNEITTNGIIFR